MELFVSACFAKEMWDSFLVSTSGPLVIESFVRISPKHSRCASQGNSSNGYLAMLKFLMCAFQYCLDVEKFYMRN